MVYPEAFCCWGLPVLELCRLSPQVLLLDKALPKCCALVVIYEWTWGLLGWYGCVDFVVLLLRGRLASAGSCLLNNLIDLFIAVNIVLAAFDSRAIIRYLISLKFVLCVYLNLLR